MILALANTTISIKIFVPGDFGIPVWNMGAFSFGVPKRSNDISESEKSTVDLNALLEPFTGVASFEDSLRSSQVHKMEFGREDLHSPGCCSRTSTSLFHEHREDGVRATGVGVHLGGPCVTGRLS